MDVTAVPGPGFAEASLEARLAFIEEQGVDTPVAWLTLGDDTVRVSIATITGPRANIRLVTVPRDLDAATELALGVREILTQLAVPPEVPLLDPPPIVGQLGVGVVVPATGLASGPRGLLQVEGTWRRGMLGLGGVAAVQLGDGQWRLGLGPVGRLGPGLIAARLDLVRLPWALWLQPRLSNGGTVGWGRVFGESRLAWAPLRDLVERDRQVIYDSGRIEWTIVIGLRQIRSR